MSLWTRVNVWMNKLPPDEVIMAENIDRSIDELRCLNERTTKVLNDLQQPDILRSLVISMNTGRNR